MAGLEPALFRLQSGCSAIELHRHVTAPPQFARMPSGWFLPVTRCPSFRAAIGFCLPFSEKPQKYLGSYPVNVPVWLCVSPREAPFTPFSLPRFR